MRGEQIKVNEWQVCCRVDDLLNKHLSIPNEFKEKKDSVSSDVEQAANKWALDNPDETMATNSALNRGFIAGYKHCQSTQQPATMSWMSNDEIRTWFKDYDRKQFEALSTIIINFQSKLKERVNCVDPRDFARWLARNASSTMFQEIWLDLGGDEQSVDELFKIFQKENENKCK